MHTRIRKGVLESRQMVLKCILRPREENLGAL